MEPFTLTVASTRRIACARRRTLDNVVPELMDFDRTGHDEASWSRLFSRDVFSVVACSSEHERG